MKCRHLFQIACGTALIGLCAARPVSAVPVQAEYQDVAAGCDAHGAQLLTHELGQVTAFPADEAIDSGFQLSTDPALFACVADDGIANDYIVRMTNLSNVYYRDLFFVVDEGYTIGNFDGEIQDLAFPGFTQAFRIDGTVTPGAHNPLLGESITVDEVFEPGEEWAFVVTNFSASTGPLFESVGKFAASSSIGFDTVSNASIVARIVPEPASASLLGLLALGLYARTRRVH